MPFSFVAAAAPYVGVAAGVNSLTGGAITNALGLTSGGGSSGGGSAGTASSGSTSSSTYDPYGPYRQQAATQLNDLMAHPETAMSQPGYQQQLQQGMLQSQRGAAATGSLQSGQEQAQLQSLGQNTFSQYYNAQLANLMQLSGASQNPAAAGLSQQQAANLAASRQAAGVSNFTSGLSAITQGAQGIANGDLGGYLTSTFGRDPLQADTGAAATTAANFYGSTYDPAAGWSN